MTSRALVLQGGGPLGAYEAGAFRVLHDWFSKQKTVDKNFFDVIAGTSIGAINAAIIVSYVKERRKKGYGVSESWKGSANKLESFWEYVSSDPQISYMWSYHWINWDVRRRTDPRVASKESARRYYVTKEFLWSGAERVFSGPDRIPDQKFFDYSSNTWYRYSNEPLKDTIQGKRGTEDFAKFPIATRVDDNEPRLIVISVDVQEGATVAFDSYPDKDGFRKSEYGRYRSEFGGGTDGEYEHVIKYDDGIELEHVMASASVPLFYDYTVIKESNFGPLRHFWDGALLSNTPLRELISEHTLFWKEKIGFENPVDVIWEGTRRQKVPDLDIYIVNLWPTKENDIPHDQDLIKDRISDIIGCDKTEYDLKVATLVDDYMDLALQLIRLAKEKRIPKDDVTEILNKLAKSRFRTGQPRMYMDLLKYKFAINEVLRIERTDDLHSISNKWADWSAMTISKLLDEGKRDALTKLINRLVDLVNNLSSDVRNRLIVHLTSAKHALDADGSRRSYYDSVWIQLTKFIEQVDAEETKGTLNKEKVALLRP
jgi:NTE family protein